MLLGIETVVNYTKFIVYQYVFCHISSKCCKQLEQAYSLRSGLPKWFVLELISRIEITSFFGVSFYFEVFWSESIYLPKKV